MQISIGVWDDSTLPLEFRAVTYYEAGVCCGLYKKPHDCFISNSIDSLLQNTCNLGYDYLFFQRSGSVYRTPLQRKVMPVIRSFIKTLPKNFLVAGQILDEHAKSIRIHQRQFGNNSLPANPVPAGCYSLFDGGFALVNLKTYANLGKPAWGEQDGSALQIIALRSKQNIHHKYTPIRLDYSPKQAMLPTYTGWNIIQTSLKNKRPVLNLSQQLRSHIKYLYPHDKPIETQAFVSSYIAKNSQLVWHSNSEPLNFNVGGKIDQIIAPAAGLKVACILKENGFDPSTQVVIYDQNPKSLELWKSLVFDWDGYDYPAFVKNYLGPNFREWTRGELDLYWQKVLKIFEGQNMFVQYWNKHKSLNHTFKLLDLVNKTQHQELLQNMSAGRSVMIVSNIYWTPSTLFKHSPLYVWESCAELSKLLAATNTYVDGFLSVNKPLD